MALGTDFALCAGAQATFRETGMPRLVMRLITLQAIRASTFCADRVRARRLRPTRTLYLWKAVSPSALAIARRGLPAHPALLGKQLEVPVALRWLGFGGVAGHGG